MVDNGYGELQGGETESKLHLHDDELYRALASTRRRRLLYVLLVEEESSIEKLATVLTGWDATETGRMATPADRTDIKTTLDHQHLPLLDDAGLVAYDRERGTVRIAPVDEMVAELISRSVESEGQSCQ